MGNKNECKRVGDLLVSCGCYSDIYNKMRHAVFCVRVKRWEGENELFLGGCSDSAVSSI